MATAARKAPVRKIQIDHFRDQGKKDRSPKWEGAAAWSGEEFTKHYHAAMYYYNTNASGKELKPQVINWMALNGYEKSVITAFKNSKDNLCSVTAGAIASCLLKGMPTIHPEFNGGRDTAVWLRKEIDRIIEVCKDDIPVAEKPKSVKADQPVTGIQDRIRDQAINISEEIESAIDSFITDPEAFDPKAFKVASLLRTQQAKAAQARYIKGFFEYGHNELLELASGKADEQLREAYRHHSRKNIKKLIEFYESVAQACEQIAAEAKVLKKPRIKKAKPAEELVKRVKFKVGDDKLGITSVPPAQLIKAQSVVLYNVRTRKLSYVISKTSDGIGVKNSSLENFSEKSSQKTLRNPTAQLKEFKELNTQKKVETWYAKSVKTTETQISGRLNEDTIILKVFK